MCGAALSPTIADAGQNQAGSSLIQLPSPGFEKEQLNELSLALIGPRLTAGLSKTDVSLL
jgi:hypothetical protein